MLPTLVALCLVPRSTWRASSLVWTQEYRTALLLTTSPYRSVCGQLLFGYLADKYGRTRLYGIELVLVIASTIGVATSSYGYGDMSFLALFTWVSSSRYLPGQLHFASTFD